MKTIWKVLIIDDHRVVIEGMTAILSQFPFVEVLGTAVNAFEAMEFLRKNEVDLVISDISLPTINGMELCGNIKKEFPQIYIIGLSIFKQRSYVSQMINNGASGYLLKSAEKSEIEEAIKVVMGGGKYFSSEININILDPHQNETIPVLTRREQEILKLIAEGLTNSEIAEKVFISQYTVDTHRKNLLAKFDVKNTALLIKKAAELMLL